MKIVTFALAAVLIAAVTVSVALGTTTQKQKVIPKYTVIALVLDQPISSKTDRVGDKFRSHCTSVNCGGFPTGTTFWGIITEARPKSGNQPGHLNAKWTTAVLPDGQNVPLSAALSSPQGAVKTGPQGKQAKAGRERKGGYLGAGIGAIAGGFEGLLIGGAAGYGAGYAARGKTTDINIQPGQSYHIVLLQPATLPSPQPKHR